MTALTCWLKKLWLTVMPKKKDDESGKELAYELRQLRHTIYELKESIMIAQTTFDTSLANLTGAVTAAAAALAATGPTTSTPDATVQAYIAGVDAQTVALASATPPPVPASLKR
jgi:predicted regulator of Ras-like GTPase activity (Roadblock/LC7/MglB family)